MVQLTKACGRLTYHVICKLGSRRDPSVIDLAYLRVFCIHCTYVQHEVVSAPLRLDSLDSLDSLHPDGGPVRSNA